MNEMAQVIPSLAMEPHVRTINGYQAACLDHPDDGDRAIIGEHVEEGVWLGEWHELWFDARLDAILHDLAIHNTAPLIPSSNWLDILKGTP